MSRTQVWRAVLIAVLSLMSAELAVRRMVSNSVPRQTMRRITAAPKVIDFLAVGNSLIAAGFDPATVERTFQGVGRSCVAVNGGLGASGPIEQLALTRLALRQHNVRTIIYGYFDTQLSDDTALTNGDLIGNHSMLYEEPQLTEQYANFDISNRIGFEVFRRIALLRERGAIWAKVERLRRQIGGLGMRSEENNRFGRKSDFTLLEATDSQHFALSCQRIVESGRFLSAPVKALFAAAHQHGTDVIVVEMPMHPEHRRTFYSEPVWRAFRADIQAAVQAVGGQYVNASDWVPSSSLFADHLHLAEGGATLFSGRLAEYLINQHDNSKPTLAQKIPR